MLLLQPFQFALFKLLSFNTETEWAKCKYQSLNIIYYLSKVAIVLKKKHVLKFVNGFHKPRWFRKVISFNYLSGNFPNVPILKRVCKTTVDWYSLMENQRNTLTWLCGHVIMQHGYLLLACPPLEWQIQDVYLQLQHLA